MPLIHPGYTKTWEINRLCQLGGVEGGVGRDVTAQGWYILAFSGGVSLYIVQSHFHVDYG